MRLRTIWRQAQIKTGVHGALMITVTPPTTLTWNDNKFNCVLGWNGVTSDKWEGDGCTPAGTYRLRKVFYRKDRVTGLKSALPINPIRTSDGWCDDPEHSFYNTLVQLPIEPLTKNCGEKTLATTLLSLWVRTTHQLSLIAAAQFLFMLPLQTIARLRAVLR